VRAVVSIEEHVLNGGVGSSVAEIMAESGFAGNKKFARIGFPDEFIHRYGSQEFLMKHYGITTEGARAKILELLK
jgi:transketolase C-terminal domain/subunit